jgi:molybdopterin synthase sulfur carrier subunit
MQVNVILFGQLKDLAGNSQIVLENVADTESLVTALHTKYPTLANKQFIIAVDKQVVSKNTSLTNNSTVALMPPFSGG